MLADKTRLAWLSLVLLAAVHVYTVLDRSLNVPFSDDFHQQLHTAISVDKNADAYPTLFRQHGVHRILTTHLPSFIELKLTGAINLNHQLMVALILLIALTLVVTSFASENNRASVVIVSALLLLSPVSSSTWVGGTIPYFALLLFGLLAIKWIDYIDKPTYLVGSTICMLLASFSMIGGLVLPVIGVFYLGLKGRLKTPLCLIWSAIAVAAIAIYFNGFVSRENQPSVFHVIKNLEFTAEFSLRVLGGFLSNLVTLDLLTVISFMVVLSFAWLVTLKTSVKEVFLTPRGLAFIYLLLVVSSVIVGRVGLEDEMTAYAARYQILTKTLWLVGLIILLEKRIVASNTINFIFGFSVLFALAMYQQKLPYLDALQQRQSNAMLDFLAHQDPSGFNFADNPAAAGRLVAEAIKREIYEPELLATPSRQIKYLKYSDFIDGLDATLIRDIALGRYHHLIFSVNTQTDVHEVAIVPREVSGPATLLKAAAKISVARKIVNDPKSSTPLADQYEVVIDTAEYDAKLTYDVLLISAGKISAIATL